MSATSTFNSALQIEGKEHAVNGETSEKPTPEADSANDKVIAAEIPVQGTTLGSATQTEENFEASSPVSEAVIKVEDEDSSQLILSCKESQSSHTTKPNWQIGENNASAEPPSA